MAIKNNKTVKDADYINISADMIEKTLEAFGIIVKVVEISIEKKYYEYYLEVAVGTAFSKLEKRSRELALALASPTGKISWQIPVPGKALIGLKVHKPPPEYFEDIENMRQWKLKQNNLRSRVAFLFFLLGQLHFLISYKILGEKD